jgi:hypothetical protein
VTALLVGIALVVLGVLVIRGREAVARMQRDAERDHARYASLLNAERANREVDQLDAPGQRRLTDAGTVVFGVALVLAGLVAIATGAGLLPA